MSGLVRGLLFGVGFGDQTFGDVPLGLRGPDYITTHTENQVINEERGTNFLS